ncbi:unnamed protein product [Acanthoscelides obtectus]|uniref:Uncharacterized protein n=1 Tax=Acanthoscelides obtectus TaxID=200917 RepID=A0A9P0P1C5_ACAOB|nr:unnamed protein product [Acanthoscelides obtectus]CAK1666064.1 hypothetical protein AOBTE_LOCUS25138 [Acanthoscelides obtectus]
MERKRRAKGSESVKQEQKHLRASGLEYKTYRLDLDKVHQFSMEHNLTINPDKTQVLLFCSDQKRKTVEDSFHLTIDGITLQHTQTAVQHPTAIANYRMDKHENINKCM